MKTMRALGYTGRFFVMGFVLWWFFVVYALGRVATLFVRGKEERRRAVAALRGRVLRRAMTGQSAAPRRARAHRARRRDPRPSSHASPHGIPGVRLSDPVGHLGHFISGILDQTDLRLEQRNYTRFRELFASTPGVHFPDVYPELSATRVMTMEMLRGRKLDALPSGDHAEIAKRLQYVFFKMVYDDGFVHADLHPGNLLLLDNGDIAIFDVGLVKHIGDDILIQVVDFTRCLVMGTTKDFVAHIEKFHLYRANDVDWVTLEKELGEFLDHFRKQNIAELELGELLNEILSLGRRYRVRPVSELALVMVAMVTAEGLGKQLNPHNNLFLDVAAFLPPVLAKRGIAMPSAA